MKLQDLAVNTPSKQISKVYESYFDSRLDIGRLSMRQTSGMLSRVRGLLEEHKNSTSRHTSERNPAYLKLMMMEQALTARLREMAPAQPAAQPAQPAQPAQASAGSVVNKNLVDPKLKAAQDKVKKGQTLTPDEQKMINNAAAQMQESRLRRAYRMLKESEVQQAQVVLAAQDMVDKMQGMLEDVSELQFKELPALVDSIKNQVGPDQATQFNTDASAALTGLLQNIQSAKQQMDAALGVVTGQAPAGIADLGMTPAPAGMAPDMGGETDELGDLDAAAADAAADIEAEPAAGQGALGRERR